MKPIFITIAFIAAFLTAKAQVTDSVAQDLIYSAVDQEPTFPGGMKELYKYFQNNLKYPDIALQNKINGKVFVTFIVEKDGSLTGIKVLKGLSPEIDAEAIRLMKECPKWSPGLLNGKARRVQYDVYVIFKSPKQKN